MQFYRNLSQVFMNVFLRFALCIQNCPSFPFHLISVFLIWQNIRRDWCWSWNSNTSATWCEELTHLKRLWCWERLRAGEEGDDRGWDGWMASLSQWIWVWVDSGSWWWTGRPGMLRFTGLQSRTWLSDWTELNWRLGIDPGHLAVRDFIIHCSPLSTILHLETYAEQTVQHFHHIKKPPSLNSVSMPTRQWLYMLCSRKV